MMFSTIFQKLYRNHLPEGNADVPKNRNYRFLYITVKNTQHLRWFLGDFLALPIT